MEEKSKKLIVYYSYTGHTKMIAERIKEKLNCDILEIKPVKPYSTDYDLVVSEEQNNSSSNKMPEIEEISIDLSNYNEIIIGTPVWWYTIAPVIRTFLKLFLIYTIFIRWFIANYCLIFSIKEK